MSVLDVRSTYAPRLASSNEDHISDGLQEAVRLAGSLFDSGISPDETWVDIDVDASEQRSVAHRLRLVAREMGYHARCQFNSDTGIISIWVNSYER